MRLSTKRNAINSRFGQTSWMYYDWKWLCFDTTGWRPSSTSIATLCPPPLKYLSDLVDIQFNHMYNVQITQKQKCSCILNLNPEYEITPEPSVELLQYQITSKIKCCNTLQQWHGHCWEVSFSCWIQNNRETEISMLFGFESRTRDNTRALCWIIAVSKRKPVKCCNMLQ